MAVLVLLFAVSLSNCSVNWRTRANHSYKAKKLPQDIKIEWGQKRKKYAPGHNNKKRPIQMNWSFIY
jgi:hypothetical protein